MKGYLVQGTPDVKCQKYHPKFSLYERVGKVPTLLKEEADEVDRRNRQMNERRQQLQLWDKIVRS